MYAGHSGPTRVMDLGAARRVPAPDQPRSRRTPAPYCPSQARGRSGTDRAVPLASSKFYRARLQEGTLVSAPGLGSCSVTGGPTGLNKRTHRSARDRARTAVSTLGCMRERHREDAPRCPVSGGSGASQQPSSWAARHRAPSKKTVRRRSGHLRESLFARTADHPARVTASLPRRLSSPLSSSPLSSSSSSCSSPLWSRFQAAVIARLTRRFVSIE